MKFYHKAFVCALVILLTPKLNYAQSNLQQFTPSVLLQKGQFEFNQFNSLYSQTKIRDRHGDDINLGERQSFLRNIFFVLYGISDTRRINIGIQTNIVTARYTSPDNSILSIFGNEIDDYKKTMLSSIGPIVKFTPFKNIGFLSIQSTLLFPISADLESPRFVDHDRISWITQLFFDKAIVEKIRVFLEAGLLYRFKKLESHENFFRIPLSTILSYFPSSEATIFASIQHSPAFGKVVGDTSSKFGQIRWFTALGLGAKYQISSSVGVELSYANFILSRADGAGSNINLGLRVII